MIDRDTTATQPWFKELLNTSVSSEEELEILI
jgi:hypothetical protein